MQVRGVVLITIALFVGITALILHLLAMCSPRWKITKRDVDPAMPPVSYGLWQRCENVNITVIKQGISLGTRPNVQVCRPNRYMRYSTENFDKCYNLRRNCPVVDQSQLPAECKCRYLPSTKALQWLTVLAAICLVIGLLILHLKTIGTAQNGSAVLVLNYGPFICFVLTLLLMVTILILVGAFLRRETYEDYSFPLLTVANQTSLRHSFELYSLRRYSQYYASTFSNGNYTAAKTELLRNANSAYHTIIGWATGFEIIATVLIFVGTAITFILATGSKREDL